MLSSTDDLSHRRRPHHHLSLVQTMLSQLHELCSSNSVYPGPNPRIDYISFRSIITTSIHDLFDLPFSLGPSTCIEEMTI